MKHTINLLPVELKPHLELLTIYTVMIGMAFSAVHSWSLEPRRLVN